MRDVGWVLQTGPCLNVLSAWGVGRTQEIKNPFQREKVGQCGEFIWATSFFHPVQRGWSGLSSNGCSLKQWESAKGAW